MVIIRRLVLYFHCYLTKLTEIEILGIQQQTLTSTDVCCCCFLLFDNLFKIYFND